MTLPVCLACGLVLCGCSDFAWAGLNAFVAPDAPPSNRSSINAGELLREALPARSADKSKHQHLPSPPHTDYRKASGNQLLGAIMTIRQRKFETLTAEAGQGLNTLSRNIQLPVGAGGGDVSSILPGAVAANIPVAPVGGLGAQSAVARELCAPIMGLTARQLTVLRFVQGYIDAKGYSPSIREIMAGTRISSFGHVYDDLVDIEYAGFIKRPFQRQRWIEILRPVTIPRIGNVPLYAVPLNLAQNGSGCIADRHSAAPEISTFHSSSDSQRNG